MNVSFAQKQFCAVQREAVSRFSLVYEEAVIFRKLGAQLKRQ